MFEVKYSTKANVYIVTKNGVTVAVLDSQQEVDEYLDSQRV